MPASLSLHSKAVFTMTTYDHFIFDSGKLQFKYKKWMYIITGLETGLSTLVSKSSIYICRYDMLRVTCQFLVKILWQCLELPRDFGSLSWAGDDVKPVQSQFKLYLDLRKRVFFLQIEGTSMVLRDAVWMSVVCCAVSRGRWGTS